MDVGQAIFNFIANPDVAYLLLILGLFSLVLAVAAPGTGFAEISAGLCLILAVIGLAQLPVNLAGLVLILVGIGLFIVDLKLQTWAVALGGAVALALGSVFLFEVTGEVVRVSLWLVGLVTLGSIAFFSFALNRVVKSRHLKSKVDPRAVIGVKGTVRTPLLTSNELKGTAQVDGELWTVSSDQPILAGTTVVVEDIDGLVLKVKPAEKAVGDAPPPED